MLQSSRNSRTELLCIWLLDRLMTSIGAASLEAWGQVAGARGDEESAHVDPSFCTFRWEDKERDMAVALVRGF